MDAIKALGSLVTFGETNAGVKQTAVVAWSTIIIITVIVGIQTGFWITMKNNLFPSGFSAGAGTMPPILQNRQPSVSGFSGTRRMSPSITNGQLMSIAQQGMKI